MPKPPRNLSAAPTSPSARAATAADATGGPQPVTVYLALGSNLGDRAALLVGAAGALSARGILRQPVLSPIYETDAIAAEPQPLYLNAVVRGQTLLHPEALLAACLAVEVESGRVRPRERPKAPRTLDIDLLLYGDQVIGSSTLTVPHPALLERPFVLIPLADVAAPGLIHPVTGTSLTSAPASAGVRAVAEGLVQPSRR